MTDPRAAAIQAACDALAEALISSLDDAPNTGTERLYGVTEAAEQLGIGRSLAYQLLSSGRLRSIRVGRRRLVAASAIDEYVRGVA